MNIPNIDSYEIKNSKTNHKLPVINKIHLHSIYNPVREAENLIKKNIGLFTKKSSILVLGLGFGYHIQQACSELKKIHGDDFMIYVIEPCSKVVDDCLALNIISLENVRILHGKTCDELYSEKNFIEFLLESPGIISHPPSFNLYYDYFKSIIKFKSQCSIDSWTDIITSKEITHYLEDYKNASDMYEIMELVRKKQDSGNEIDYLLLALHEMTSSPQNRAV